LKLRPAAARRSAFATERSGARVFTQTGPKAATEFDVE
jgi:hypothetical protein